MMSQTVDRTHHRTDRLRPMTEQVLVLPRDQVPGGCDFSGLRAAGDADMADLRRAVAAHGRYLDRPVAEEIARLEAAHPVRGRARRRAHLSHGAHQRRRATRGCIGKASIGVGGHLNPVDAGEDPLQGGLRREWAEELDAGWEPEFHLLGLLNDDSNPVGSVHLGVVFQVEAAGRPVRVRETDKLSGRMADASEVAPAWDRLETWSQLVAAELLGVVAGARRGDASTRLMVRLRRALTLGALLLGTLSLALPAVAADDHVVRLELEGVIDQVNAAYIEQGLATAAEGEAAAALIEIDSPGGELTSMDRIIKAMLGSAVPVITYVTAGRGAGRQCRHLHHAGRRRGGHGALDHHRGGVGGRQRRSRPPRYAGRQDQQLERGQDQGPGGRAQPQYRVGRGGRARRGQRLAAEAVAMDPPVVDLVATDVEDLFAQIDTGQRADGQPYEFEGQPLPPLSGLPIQDVSMSLGQSFLHLLSDPNIAFILFTIGFYGIVSELFHPNFFSGSGGRDCAGAGLHRLQQPAAERGRAAADPARDRPLHPGAARDVVRLLTIGGVIAIVLGGSRCGPALIRSRTPSTSRSAHGCWPWWWRCRWPTCMASSAR